MIDPVRKPRSAGKTVGGVWLTFFLGYWAWRFAGIIGIALIVAVWIVLVVWARRR